MNIQNQSAAGTVIQLNKKKSLKLLDTDSLCICNVQMLWLNVSLVFNCLRQVIKQNAVFAIYKVNKDIFTTINVFGLIYLKCCHFHSKKNVMVLQTIYFITSLADSHWKIEGCIKYPNWSVDPILPPKYNVNSTRTKKGFLLCALGSWTGKRKTDWH